MERVDRAPPSDRLRILRENSALRRNTFTKHHWQEPSKTDLLVEKGFIFVGSGGNDDRIQCSYCGGILHGLHTNVSREHDQNFPHCPFIRTLRDGGNVGFSRIDGTILKNQTVEGRIQVDGAPCSDKKIYDQERYHRFKSIKERQKSFEDWPRDSHMKPEDLAEAGLFYSGEDDKCICHYCGGELDQWEEGDIPKVEHDKNFFTICGLSNV